MKSKHVLLLQCTLLASALSAVSASAAEYDMENVPVIPDYATVVEQLNEETGQTEKVLSLHQGGRAWTSSTLHTIISAYGGAVDTDEVEAVPGYMSVRAVPNEETGETDMELVFSPGGKAWTASSIHNILTTYGLEFDMDNHESVPGYAAVQTVMDENKQEKKMLSFDSGGRMWTASSLHTILGAYN